jgi:DNA-binding LacI/PurR family transcriptional regulator
MLVGALTRGAATTLEEVARLAGVSRATASRVFTANPRVSDDARRAVERAAGELGYVPNWAARSLVTGRSDSVGVVIPEPTGRLFADPFFPRLVRGIGEVLTAHRLQLVLFVPQSSDDENRLEKYLAGRHVDAVLLVSLHGSDPLPGRLQERGIPVVVGGRPLERSDLSFVDIDNQAGGRSATEHLVAEGRRRIAHIAGPLDMPAGFDRLQGYRAALAGAGLEGELVEHGDFGRETGETAMERLLARDPQLDAVFVASDLMAAGALRALQAAGRSVPADVALIGFDDSPIATSTLPQLSSVRQPIEEMGREMARLVLRLSGATKPVPRQVVLGTELALRASSGGERG